MTEYIVRSPVTGTVWKIEAGAGEAVAEGTVLLILESMKMEVPVASPAAGTLVEFRAAEGEQIDEDLVLAVVRS